MHTVVQHSEMPENLKLDTDHLVVLRKEDNKSDEFIRTGHLAKHGDACL